VQGEFKGRTEFASKQKDRCSLQRRASEGNAVSMRNPGEEKDGFLSLVVIDRELKQNEGDLFNCTSKHREATAPKGQSRKREGGEG